METLLLLVESWWWVAPAAAGAGAATYVGVTTRGRRARRLELDAARHEETTARRALMSARVRVSEAQAGALAARASSGAAGFGSSFLDDFLHGSGLVGTPEMIAAKRQLLDAKRAEKSAAFALRASRLRIKAISAQYHSSSAHDPLPIERLFAAHDAVTARWMAYETDLAKALTYPQLSDTRHPATLAFFRANRVAQELRPASARERIPPEQYLQYRDAVRALEAAFDEAERQAGAAELPSSAPRTGIWPVPGWRPVRQQSSD